MGIIAKPISSIVAILSLLVASPVGLAQQAGAQNIDSQDDFHPHQILGRIKDTRALGGLTKLSLKKDYDRLLARALDYHEGDDSISIEQLREQYDVMIHRLTSLLQDKDEELVLFLDDSRDKYWLVLADQQKFANMMGISIVSAPPDSPQSDVDPASDLRTVIILAGYACKSVVEYSRTADSAYQVSCDADRHYRVHVDEEKDVIVHRRSDSGATEPPDEMSHDELMKKHLLSVVNLAGHDCAGLSSYERYGFNSQLVTCENQAVYRIQVTPEGRVAVAEHPTRK